MTPKKRASGPSGTAIPHAERAGVRVDLYLSTDLARRVDARAKAAAVTRSEYIRAVLDAATR